MEKVLFIIYNLLLLFLFPFFFIAMLILALTKNKKSEGFVYKFFPSLFKPLKNVSFKGGVWIHAVSLGEIRASVYFIELLQSSRFKKVFLSATTKTGYEFAKNKYKNDGGVSVFYFPYDFYFSIKNILKIISPSLFVSMETEIWPNLFSALNEKKISIAIINARISDKSYKHYLKLSFFFRRIFKKINLVLCMSENYKDKFINLGVPEENVKATGNMKFDLNIGLVSKDIEEKSEKLKKIFNKGKIVAAGSTHAGEEELIISAVSKINEKYKENKAYLFIAPRHPERFGEVSALLERRGFKHARLSSIYSGEFCGKAGAGSGGVMPEENVGAVNFGSGHGGQFEENGGEVNFSGGGGDSIPGLKLGTHIVLVDLMGELLTVYSICNAAFVGGSMVNAGGHNILEPLFFGKPVIFGNYIQNFSEIAQEIVDVKAGRIVSSPQELYDALVYYIYDENASEEASKNGTALLSQNKGITRKNLDFLARYFGNGNHA